MAIIVTCLCGKQFRVSDEAAGQTMTCPVCAATVLVPRLEIGRSDVAEHLPSAGQYLCTDCGKPFWPQQLVNDRGDLVCHNCLEHGPPRKPMSTRTKKILLIFAGILFLLALNTLMAYFFFFANP